MYLTFEMQQGFNLIELIKEHTPALKDIEIHSPKNMKMGY
jgi:hypothetical protein